MNVVYLIGNGFDIACGLDTSAKTIISKYRDELRRHVDDLKDKKTDEYQGCRLFLDSIDSEFDTWADFEKKLGEITKEFDSLDNPKEAFLAAFSNFRTFLRGYLQNQQSRIESIGVSKSMANAFHHKCLGFMSEKMRPASKNSLNSFLNLKQKEHWSIDYMVFNYTYLVDQLIDAVDEKKEINISNFIYQRSPKVPLHIHGNLFDEYGLLVGVDNKEQIASEQLRNDEDILNALVKTRQNRNNELERDSAANGLIRNADLIVIHGMSLGESDSMWWRQIGKWLSSSSNHVLVLSHFDPAYDEKNKLQPEYHSQLTRQVRDDFLDKTNLSDDLREKCYERILISVNDSFNAALNPLIRELRSAGM